MMHEHTRSIAVPTSDRGSGKQHSSAGSTDLGSIQLSSPFVGVIPEAGSSALHPSTENTDKNAYFVE